MSTSRARDLLRREGGDADAVAEAKAAWYANGDAIAAFLANANPRNWELVEMQDDDARPPRPHAEGGRRATRGPIRDDAAAYDEIHVQILHMADMLSDGILAQFPARFDR